MNLIKDLLVLYKYNKINHQIIISCPVFKLRCVVLHVLQIVGCMNIIGNKLPGFSIMCTNATKCYFYLYFVLPQYHSDNTLENYFERLACMQARGILLHEQHKGSKCHYNSWKPGDSTNTYSQQYEMKTTAKYENTTHFASAQKIRCKV